MFCIYKSLLFFAMGYSRKIKNQLYLFSIPIIINNIVEHSGNYVIILLAEGK